VPRSIGPERAVDSRTASYLGIVIIKAWQARVAANVPISANVLQTETIPISTLCERSDQCRGSAWWMPRRGQYLDQNLHGVAPNTVLTFAIGQKRQPGVILFLDTTVSVFPALAGMSTSALDLSSITSQVAAGAIGTLLTIIVRALDSRRKPRPEC
jgi:hypothetical protein